MVRNGRDDTFSWEFEWVSLCEGFSLMKKMEVEERVACWRDLFKIGRAHV